jgi:hypothetical protein
MEIILEMVLVVHARLLVATIRVRLSLRPKLLSALFKELSLLISTVMEFRMSVSLALRV